MIIQEIQATNCTPQTIVIGRRGTYDTMQIAFDLSYLVENYGSGTAVLAVKRSQDESAYPTVVTQEDNTLTWTVSETDTYYVGSGECQLMWYVDGGLAKTIIYPMVVMRDILSTAEEPPDGYENWIESLTALGAETHQNAQNAAQSASDASTAKDDAVTAKEAAEDAQQAAETAVTHYPKIENNYWMVWDVASQSYVSTGIQAEGEDGYSPEISITTITGGHRVTITDKDHPQGQSFDVLDGHGGGGGTSDYTNLTNKPKINNVELDGNKTAHELGLAAQTDIPTVPVQSVNGKTGAVNLASGDIAYDESATYPDGSVGAKLQEQTRHLSDLDDDVTDTQGMLATVETTATASKSYAVGDLLVFDGKLYKVTSGIATGATIIVGSNVTQTTVESQIAAGGGGGGSEKTWKKFRDVTVTLDKPTTNVTYVEGTDGITQFSFSVDDDGNSFEFTDIKILAIVKNITGEGLVMMFSGTRASNVALMSFRGQGVQGQTRVYEFESVLIDGARFYSGIYGTQYANTINQLAPNQIVNDPAFGGNYNNFLNGFVENKTSFNKVNMITMYFGDATVEGRLIFFGK